MTKMELFEILNLDDWNLFVAWDLVLPDNYALSSLLYAI
jgi:hypothetical protein